MRRYTNLLLIAAIVLVLVKPVSAYKTVEFISEFGGKGESLGKFSDKTRFAFDKNGNIYVVDTDNLSVQKLNPGGKPMINIVGGDEFQFARPMDLAVDGELNIYVVDWNAVHISGTESPKIFNYGPCVHKFSSDGKFIATFSLEDLSQKIKEKENAIPAVDTDGNFALMIVPQKTDRQLYIAADAAGNLYVLDQNVIHKLSSTGEILARFAKPGGGHGQLDKATGIAADADGNIYVADTGNHRIVKFASDGKFLLSFGKKGHRDGHLSGKLYVMTASDGTVLVADSAKYKKTLKTAIRHRKIINSNILVTGQDDPLIPRRRSFQTVMRRYQRFDENGRFQEKILYRIDKSDPELRNLDFKAVDPAGNLYLVDKDTLTIRKHSIEAPVRWSEVEKTLSCRLQHNDNTYQIDNFYDLNSFVDFDEHERYTQVTVTMKLSYDMTESFSVSLANSLTSLSAKTYDKYPGERSDRRGFIQDDVTTDSYVALRVRLDLGLILDHDPFKYRVGNLFGYFGGGRYDFDIRATDFSNQRKLDEHLWWTVWAVGARYDMGRDMRLSLIAAQHRPSGYMNYEYEYWDENGVLYGTGAGRGVSTEVFVSVDGAF